MGISDEATSEESWFDRAVRIWMTEDYYAARKMLDEGWEGIVYGMGYLGDPERVEATKWWRAVEGEYRATKA